MTEQFLHYVWFQKLFSPLQLTIAGEAVEIVDIGQLNTDAGPDVFNAKVKINNTLWAGNVEFHQKSSDWMRHGHTHNPSYNSVILHVVFEVDAPIYRRDGSEIPQLILKFSPHLKEQFETLQEQKSFIACEQQIAKVSAINLHNWFDRLLVERMEQKTEVIEKILTQTTNNWEEAFYIILARNFGFSTNALAFELLAKSIPLVVLAKHKNSLLQLEALLFGQAGFLQKSQKSDSYFIELQKEYLFLRAKYHLEPIDVSLWKFLRLRPANFPTIRIAQFASLIHTSSKLFSKILENSTYSDLQQLFQGEVSTYWTTHYLFGEDSAPTSKKLSKTSKDGLLINTVVPFLFHYGKLHQCEQFMQRSFDLLTTIAPEKNHIVTGFDKCGVKAHSAYDSQALIQLKRAYCDVHKCLQCHLSKQVLYAK